MGYKIIMNQGNPEMSFDADPTIATDLALSCLVEKGSFFFDMDFGLRAMPKKNTPENAALVPGYFDEAVKWLLDTGQAKTINVIAEPDNDNPDRVNVKVDAVQANDAPAEFETFVEVV